MVQLHMNTPFLWDVSEETCLEINMTLIVEILERCRWKSIPLNVIEKVYFPTHLGRLQYRVQINLFLNVVEV